MAELSSNPRARAATLYRMKSIHELEVVPDCSELDAGDHIDAHKDELYGMLSVLCNDSLRDTLGSRDGRGEFGLVAPGPRVLRHLPNERYVNRCMVATLEHDARYMFEMYAELVEECDVYLSHLHEASDRTMHPTTWLMMSGGILTAVMSMDMTYTTLTDETHGLSANNLKESWRVVYDQTKIGIKELIVLPMIWSPEERRQAIFTVDESNIASFCASGLRSVEGLQNIPERTTIGCPVSFEPELVRELWEWYIDLRGKVEINQVTALPAESNA